MPSLLDEQTQYVDDGGKPIVNGFLYIGVQNADPVLNPISIFSDRELTIALANPQLLDAEGRAANKIWVDGRYSMKVEDFNNVQQYQELDNGEETSTGVTTLGNVQGGDSITAEASATITAYIDLQEYVFGIVQTNTTDVTLDIDGIGPIPVQKNVGEELSPGDFVAGQRAVVIYNATSNTFQWVNRDSIGAPVGYLTGALITRDVSDVQDFNVSSGAAVDSTNAVSMTLQAFSKRADTAWAVGDLGGALLSGALAANTSYDIWAILTTDESTTDYGIDTVANGITNIPAGYLLSRKIGRLFTDANIDILPEIFSENDRGFPQGFSSGGVMAIGTTTTAITSVTDNAGAAQFNHASGPVLVLGQLVTISGFTTNTAYNGTFVVTTVTATTFTCGKVVFGSNETGSFDNQDLTAVKTNTLTARDDLNVADLIGDAMQKHIDAAWAVGDGNGGLFSGSVANDTVYYFFAIQADADGTIDYGFDTSPIAANIPTGYTAYKQLSRLLTNATGDLINSMQGVFRSEPQTVTSAGTFTLPHGLGTLDFQTSTFLHFLDTDDGWAPGDISEIGPGWYGNSSSDGGVAYSPTDTEVTGTFGSSVSAFAGINKSTGDGAANARFTNTLIRYLVVLKVR